MDMTKITALIEEQGKAFEAFKTEHQEALDDQAMRIAGLQIGSQESNVARGMRNNNPAFTEFRDFMRNGVRAELSGSSNPDGGYAVPKEVDGAIHDQLISLSPMRSIARVVRTTSRDYHTLIGARGTTSGWVGEEDNRTATESPELVDVAPPSGEVYAYPSATNWVLDDAQFDLAAWLQDNVATELAYQEGLAFTAGNGSKKPKGILDYTGTGDHELGPIQTVKSGAASTLTVDGLIDLVYDLAAPYRANAVFLLNSRTAGEVRKLKDGSGNLIWQPGLQQGQPGMILGHAVVIDESMPDVAVNARPVAFGDFKRGYLITDRGSISVIRDQVTKPGWTKFYFAKRVGGAVTDPAALRLQKIAA